MASYVAEIKRIMKAAKEVRQKSIILISSLICYPNHLESLGCPTDIYNKSTEYEFSTVIMICTFLESFVFFSNFFFQTLRKDVYQILIEFANTDPEPEHKVMSIWGLCTFIFEELLHTPK
jgi:hypothetical protein